MDFEMDWDKYYEQPSAGRYWPCEELVRFGGRMVGRLGSRVLEVGCGNGANLSYLRLAVGRVVGLDLSVTALALVARGRELGLVAGDLRRLPFGMATFGGLVDCMVSQHVPWAEHLSVYREYHRVMRRGGWLFLYHLDGLTLCEREKVTGGATYDVMVSLFPTAGPMCLPAPAHLAAEIERAGFGQIELRGLAREYPDGNVAHYSVISGEAWA